MILAEKGHRRKIAQERTGEVADGKWDIQSGERLEFRVDERWDRERRGHFGVGCADPRLTMISTYVLYKCQQGREGKGRAGERK